MIAKPSLIPISVQLSLADKCTDLMRLFCQTKSLEHECYFDEDNQPVEQTFEINRDRKLKDFIKITLICFTDNKRQSTCYLMISAGGWRGGGILATFYQLLSVFIVWLFEMNSCPSLRLRKTKARDRSYLIHG